MKAWRTPTRRAFVGMIATAAAALAAQGPKLALPGTGNNGDDGGDEDGEEADRPRSTWAGTTRWIGHC